jgi:hypothetical protein
MECAVVQHANVKHHAMHHTTHLYGTYLLVAIVHKNLLLLLLLRCHHHHMLLLLLLLLVVVLCHLLQFRAHLRLL